MRTMSFPLLLWPFGGYCGGDGVSEKDVRCVHICNITSRGRHVKHKIHHTIGPAHHGVSNMQAIGEIRAHEEDHCHSRRSVDENSSFISSNR